MIRECTLEVFLADVAKHQMRVLRDDGLYRHLYFTSGSFNQWFEIVTWPGALALNGDMGSWTFARIEDMFSFFRSRREIEINPDYWAEKLQAKDAHGGPREWNAEAFRQQVVDHLDNFDLAPEDRAWVEDDLRDAVFAFESRHEALQALCDYSARGVEFDMGDAPDGMIWSFRYIWCLYAIVWGIRQYDSQKNHERPA